MRRNCEIFGARGENFENFYLKIEYQAIFEGYWVSKFLKFSKSSEKSCSPKMILCGDFREILTKTRKVIQFDTILSEKTLKFSKFSEKFSKFLDFRKKFEDQKLQFSKIFRKSFFKNQ